MVEYRRDTENLKRAIREHTVHGYPIVVPDFGDATAISTSTIRGLTSILASIDNPKPFKDYAEKKGWKNIKQDRESWEQFAKDMRMPAADTAPLKWMHSNSQAALEEGYKLSMQDIQRTWLQELGHLTGDNITKFSFNLDSVYMEFLKLEPGMIVTFHDNKSRLDYPGRVIAKGTDPKDHTPVIYLESFEPIPALLAPKAMAPWLLEPSFTPDRTWALGYGTVNAMKIKRVKIPKGVWDKEERIYYLDQPIPLSQIEQFCSKKYPENPQCLWQSMVFLVVPLHPFSDSQNVHSGGEFRPFPDDTDRTDIEAQIDYFGGAMEFEE